MNRNLNLGLRLGKRDRLLMVIVPILIVIVFVLLGKTYITHQKKTVEFNQHIIHTLAENQRNEIDVFIDNRLELLNMLAAQPEIYGMDMKEQMEAILYWTKRSGFSHIFVVDNQGIAFYPTEHQIKNQSNDSFVWTINSRETYVSDVYNSSRYGPIATLCTAVRRPDGVRVGTLCGGIYLNDIRSIVKNNKVVLGGKCYILDVDSQNITMMADDGAGPMRRPRCPRIGSL